MRPRVRNIKHELVFSTAQQMAGSRDGKAGNRPAQRKNQGSRTGGAGNVRSRTRQEV